MAEEKKRRKGDKPQCEKLPNKLPYKKLSYYPDPLNRRALRVGIGLFWNGKSPGPVIMEFKEHSDGTINWTPRTIVNKNTGQRTPHYDMVQIKATAIKDLRRMLGEALEEWFGGQRAADDKMYEFEEAKKKDTLTSKIRRIGFA